MLQQPSSTHRIQSFGALVVVDDAWCVTAVSDNLEDVCAAARRVTPGQWLRDAMGRQFAHDMRGLGQGADSPGDVVRERGYLPGRDDGHGEGPLDIAVQRQANGFSLELERAPVGASAQPDALARRFLSRLTGMPDMMSLSAAAARQMRLFCRTDHAAIVVVEENRPVQVLSQAGVGRIADIDAETARDDPVIGRALRAGHAGMGLVADVSDGGVKVRLAADWHPAAEQQGDAASWPPGSLGFPSEPEREALRSAGAMSALWLPFRMAGGARGLVYCRHSQSMPSDSRRRAAAELGAQVFGLMLQARLSDQAARDAMAVSKAS